MSILVAGHYCHDTVLDSAGEHRALGGSAAYASAVLQAFGEPFEVAAKVGADFLYGEQVARKPLVVQNARTTSFVDDYRSGERRERVLAVCEPLLPSDLSGSYQVGMACGVAGEIPPETLARLRALCRVVVADAQSVLRRITPRGEVCLSPLPEGAAAQLDFLKASKREAALLDVAKLRTQLTVVITDSARGCTVFTAREETRLPAFPAEERDPTGAGDCFLAGFAVGIARGLDALRAARIGAYCGARAVERVGVPRFTQQEVRAALESA